MDRRGSGFPDEHTFGEFPDEAGGIAGWAAGELLDRDAVLRRNSLTAHTPGEPRKHFHSNGRNQQHPQKASGDSLSPAPRKPLVISYLPRKKDFAGGVD